MRQNIIKIFHVMGSVIAGFYLAFLHLAFVFTLPSGLILIVVSMSLAFSLNFEADISPYILGASLIGIGLFFYHFVWKNGCSDYLKSFQKTSSKGCSFSTERLIEIGEAGKRAAKKD